MSHWIILVCYKSALCWLYLYQCAVLQYLDTRILYKVLGEMMKVVFVAVIAINAALAQHGYEGYGHGYSGHDEHAPAHYHYEYGVHDPHTHDVKSQHEHRDGDHVKGGYTLKEADGTQRIVEYTSGPHEGFQAVVRRVGHAQHPAHYGKLGHGHGGVGGTSYVGVTHWGHGSGR